jgi:hypothetical protein
MATSTTPVEFSPLPSTREERGRQIAQLGRIRPLGAAYVVPSQSVRGDAPPTYLVDLVDQTCTCPDYATRRMVCKHQEAVLFWLAWEGTVNEDTGQIELPRSERKPKRKTYPRNWPAYNAAQLEEKAHVEEDTIAKVARGRRPVTARLAIRVARLIEVGVDELLAGRHLSSRLLTTASPSRRCTRAGRGSGSSGSHRIASTMGFARSRKIPSIG